MKKVVLFAFVILTLLGCSNKKLEPISSYAIKAKAECSSAPSFEIRLTVETHNDEYNSRNLYYEKGLLRARYLYSAWSSAPTQALQNSIMTNFADCKVKAIYNDMPILGVSKNLDIVLQNFEQDFNHDGSSYGYLRAQVWLLDPDGQKSKTFEIRVPAKTNDALGGIEALNSASAIFITDLMKWINK